MPIFEYKCKECEEKFDHLVLSANQAPPVCPKCGAEGPVKQISTFSTSGDSSRGPSTSFSGAPT
jgi:putative FmdB family regulatory protein